MNFLKGTLKYPNNPKLAPSPLTIISIKSNDRLGINCWRVSKIIPMIIPKNRKFIQILGFRTET